MFTVTVIEEVDPIKYWIMPGDTFMLYLRKQYSEINWYVLPKILILLQGVDRKKIYFSCFANRNT